MISPRPRVEWLVCAFFAVCHAGCAKAPAGSPTSTTAIAAPAPLSTPAPCNAERDMVLRVLRASHASAPTELERVSLGRGERHMLPFDVAPYSCALISAIGGCGVEALSLRLLESGSPRSLDTMGRTHAHGLLCAREQPVTAAAWIEIVSGQGEVELLRHDIDKSATEAFDGPRLPALSSAAGLEEIRASIATDMTARGFTAGNELQSSAMTAGEARVTPLALRRGSCVSLRAFGDPSIGDIDLEVLAEDGRLVAADRRPMPLPEVGLCATEDRQLTVRVICMRGQGEAQLYAFELRGLTEEGDPIATIAEALLRHRLCAVGLNAQTRPSSLERRDDAVWTTATQLEGGQCHAAAVWTDTGLERVVVRASDGAEAATWQGPGTEAVLTLCPRETAQFSLEVTSFDGKAPRVLWSSSRSSPRSGAAPASPDERPTGINK